MTIGQVAQRALRTLDHNSPLILTGLAVAGVVSTAVFAVKVTPEAAHAIQAYEEKENGLWIKSTSVEKVRIAWRLYIPAAGMGVLTIAAIIGAQSINSRRQAALISGFTVAETAFREYRDKVVELDGAKADEKIRDAVMKDHVVANPPNTNELILSDGLVLCYDDWSGRYFQSSMERIRQAQNDVNETMINGDMYASLNDFYVGLGLKHVKGGEDVGWSSERLLDINFTSILTEGGLPCLAMGFRTSPLQDYSRFH